MIVRLETSQIQEFAQASHDLNPAHVSPAYARGTPFGTPIAHGILAALTCLGRIPERPGQRLARVVMEFPRPVYAGRDYQLQLSSVGDAEHFALLDGSKPLLRGAATFGPGEPPPVTAGYRAHAHRTTSARATVGDLRPGFTVKFPYWPEPVALASLMAQHQLSARGISLPEVAALLGASYLVGMELPGEQALFSHLALAFAHPAEVDPAGEPALHATVETFNPRACALRLGIELRVGTTILARGTARSFVREAVGESAASTPGDALDEHTFRGKTAVVMGGSRGLGRALARSLAARGCVVIATQSGAQSPSPVSEPRIRTFTGDAADPVSCQALATLLAQEHGRIDFLFCNASPHLEPITLELATLSRARSHIDQAVALAVTPVAALLPLLRPPGSWIIFSSSSAVERGPADWAHYVAAKLGVEALLTGLVRQHPNFSLLLARLPRLRTTFTNNFAGEPALDPGAAAQAILQRLAGPAAPGVATQLEHLLPAT